MAKLVSETYGEALFSLGLEKGIVDSLMEEIDALRGILEEIRTSAGTRSWRSFRRFLKGSFRIPCTVFWRC